MRIAQINSSDISGGAAKAALRLCESLLHEKINIKYFVKTKHSDLSYVSTVNTPLGIAQVLLGALTEQLPLSFSTSPNKKYFHHLTPLSGIKLSSINKWSPDIIHLHQINYGAFALKQLEQANTPIVWTLHDCWPITGGCHYPFNCTHFTNHCGNCHLLDSKKANDLSHQQFKTKYQLYQKLNLSFIAPSQWMARLARQSSLTANKRIVHIPNSVDAKLFCPLNQKSLRLKYQLPLHKKIILFIAHKPLDPRKGFNHLKTALNLLNARNNDFFLLIIGDGQQFNPDLACKWHIINYQVNEDILVELINCADMTICPSQEDNLPNIILESMACGVPVIAFANGGIPEIITDGVNGLLTAGNPTALSHGINTMLTVEGLSVKMSIASRATIMQRFNPTIQALAHLQLYNELLSP